MTTTIDHTSPNGVAYSLSLTPAGDVLLAALISGVWLELVFPTAEAAHEYAEAGLVG